MKIVFATSWFTSYGGQEIAIQLLLTELRNAGHDVHVITLKSWFGSNNVATLDHLSLIPKKLLVPGTPVTDHIIAAYLAEELRKTRPDIIHIQDEYILPASVLANRKLGLPCIFTCHSNVLAYSRKSASVRERVASTLFKMRRRTYVECLKNVQAIISVSEYIKKELVSMGVESGKVYKVYNIPLNNSESIQRIPIEKSGTILFALGRLVWNKGFDVVLKAIKIVSEKDPSVKLIIAGVGPEMKNLKKLIAVCQLESQVLLTGLVSENEIMKLYNQSDIVLLPSISPEPFGRVSIEAMGFGKPVIASNIGGIPEAIIHGVNGLLIPPNNPEKTAEAILMLVENRHLRENMGKAGREILEKRFKTEKLVHQTIELYEKVLLDNKKGTNTRTPN